MEIGALIKHKRTEKGLTMKGLADLMGVSEGTISRWESGDIENIKRKKIAKLSELLGISIYTLMGWAEPEEVDVEKEVQKNMARLYEASRKSHEDLEKAKVDLRRRMLLESLKNDKRLSDVFVKISNLPKDDQDRMLNMIESIIENSRTDKEDNHESKTS